MLDKLIEDYENGIHPVTREVLPEELASEQLKRLLGRNSPLLNLAREQGINLAAGRGLMNSSLAGASAVNAMVEKMAPFAVADAATYAGAARENMAAMNEAEFRRYQTLGQLLAQGMDIEGAWERAVLGSQTAIKTTEMDNAARVQVAGIAAAASRYSSDRAYQAALERIQSAERMQLSQQEWASAENEAARNLQQQLFQEEWGFRISENETERAWRTGEAALDREFNAFLRDNQYAAQDRWNAAQLVGNMNLGRAQEIASINQNPNISNAQRENAIRQANERWDQNIQDSLAAMGISFDFGTGP